MASLLNMSGGSLLGKGLPYDYEVEYLESTGTQWIDTGVGEGYDSTLWTLQCDFQHLTTSHSYLWLIFAEQTANGKYFGIQRNYDSIYINGAYSFGTVIPLQKRAFHFDGYIIGIDDKEGTIRIDLGTNIVLFGIPDSIGQGHNETCRIWSVKITYNNTIVRDLIPVRIGNVGYMYDRVSGQLFGNSGTGSFILGADKH